MKDSNDPAKRQSDPADAQSDESPKVINAQELFDGEREICIEHEGEMYRLRITRRNKLILQK